jgi:hypothetical protein
MVYAGLQNGPSAVLASTGTINISIIPIFFPSFSYYINGIRMVI